MRFYIIFGITFILCGYLFFFDPFAKYLGIYKDSFVIEQKIFEDGYHWECLNDDLLSSKKINENTWDFDSIKNGETSVVFSFVNDEDPKNIKYTINYEFKIFFNQIFWTVGEGYGLNDFPNPY